MEDQLPGDQFATIYPYVNSRGPIVEGSIVRRSILHGSKHSVKHKEIMHYAIYFDT